MIGDFFNFLTGAIFDFFNGFFSIFPQMPFDAQQVSDMMGLQIVATVLSWVNYFLPLDVAAATIALWSTAMMAYVGIKLALKYTEKIV